jgi:hypothetical protein
MKNIGVGSVLTRAFSRIALGMALLGGVAARAQDSSIVDLKLTYQLGDHSAIAGATSVHHARQALTPAGKLLRSKELADAKQLANTANNADPAGGILRYEGDVSYLGGALVDSAQFHAVYMLPNGTCNISVCWGDPEGFLGDLGKSNFIHLADQYVGLGASNRYTVGFRAKVTYAPPKVPLTDADIEEVVHLVASATGATGYGHIYHVFLPPGQDVCFTSADTDCYSPDNPSVFDFCGYHSSVTFTDIGHVLYTVQPYQNVQGCQVKPGSPNGTLIDSTDNVLNHESFETITDPDITAWINTTSIAMYGDEVADECEFVAFVGENSYFDPPTFAIYAHKYAVQSIYANSVHACATAP